MTSRGDIRRRCEGARGHGWQLPWREQMEGGEEGLGEGASPTIRREFEGAGGD